MKNKNFKAGILLPLALLMIGGNAVAGESVPMRTMADTVHAVLAADRTAYTRYIVNRLSEEKNIKASAHWKDEQGLPLPTQMLSMSAELVQESFPGLSYSLISAWPVNKKDAPTTEAEKAGLQYIADHPGQAYYAQEELAGSRYFTAVYPDIAVAQACVSCHNNLLNHTRPDFRIGDAMGAMVVRIPLN